MKAGSQLRGGCAPRLRAPVPTGFVAGRTQPGPCKSRAYGSVLSNVWGRSGRGNPTHTNPGSGPEAPRARRARLRGAGRWARVAGMARAAARGWHGHTPSRARPAGSPVAPAVPSVFRALCFAALRGGQESPRVKRFGSRGLTGALAQTKRARTGAQGPFGGGAGAECGLRRVPRPRYPGPRRRPPSCEARPGWLAAFGPVRPAIAAQTQSLPPRAALPSGRTGDAWPLCLRWDGGRGVVGRASGEAPDSRLWVREAKFCLREFTGAPPATPGAVF